ncbi:UspA domain protein [Xylanimonas cellulosilytica DSM 15894]|uniref:UspA domain protein n=1 Tax=Xylanimonas cellulosilytica (strain DSM 15894 / JCM 12276 / CECT 5975 / KCTC 9989 / LMG 20990 / NBRC 107835 / XIL07) TaxID=446471 RepID=D1BUJ0_XYLCX|nr:universal stress protein [Xylanimonas cellulosilytica]ACZ29231.1 UspA domain protein [Xylanimonas cellulosilytica DSM 15894]
MVTWRQGVVVGVDGSEEGYRALDWAAAAADRHAAPLTVVGAYAVALVAVPVGGVLDAATLHDGARHVVARATSRLGSRRPGGHEVVADVVPGAAAHVLVQHSRTADLVVVGRRGLGAVDRVLAGSVSSAVAAMAHGRVAVVPASAVGTTPRRVVVGVDVEDPGPELEAAFDEAAQLGAGVEVVHAVDPDLLGETLAAYEGWGDAWRAQADGAVRAGVARWSERYPRVRVTTRVEDGRPADVLLRALRPDDLVVVGGRSHRRVVGRLLRSVPDRLLRSAPCAVLIVHPA